MKEKRIQRGGAGHELRKIAGTSLWSLSIIHHLTFSCELNRLRKAKRFEKEEENLFHITIYSPSTVFLSTLKFYILELPKKEHGAWESVHYVTCIRLQHFTTKAPF